MKRPLLLFFALASCSGPTSPSGLSGSVLLTNNGWDNGATAAYIFVQADARDFGLVMGDTIYVPSGGSTCVNTGVVPLDSFYVAAFWPAPDSSWHSSGIMSLAQSTGWTWDGRTQQQPTAPCSGGRNL